MLVSSYDWKGRKTSQAQPAGDPRQCVEQCSMTSTPQGRREDGRIAGSTRIPTPIREQRGERRAEQHETGPVEEQVSQVSGAVESRPSMPGRVRGPAPEGSWRKRIRTRRRASANQRRHAVRLRAGVMPTNSRYEVVEGFGPARFLTDRSDDDMRCGSSTGQASRRRCLDEAGSDRRRCQRRLRSSTVPDGPWPSLADDPLQGHPSLLRWRAAITPSRTSWSTVEALSNSWIGRLRLWQVSVPTTEGAL